MYNTGIVLLLVILSWAGCSPDADPCAQQRYRVTIQNRPKAVDQLKVQVWHAGKPILFNEVPRSPSTEPVVIDFPLENKGVASLRIAGIRNNGEAQELVGDALTRVELDGSMGCRELLVKLRPVDSECADTKSPPAKWCRISPPSANLQAIHGTDHENVWAAGDQGVILRFQGERWVTSYEPHNQRLSWNGLWVSAPDDVWAVGTQDANSALSHFDGTRWTTSNGQLGPLRAIWGSDANDIWTVGNKVILHWNGSDWEKTDTDADLYAIWGTDPNHIWAVGQSSVLFWNSTTKQWSDLSPKPPVDTKWTTVWTASPNELWISDGVKNLLHLEQNPSPKWTPSGDMTVPSPIFGAKTGEAWGLRSNKLCQIERMSGNCTDQQTANQLPTLSALWIDELGQRWAVGYSGNILRTDVNGLASVHAAVSSVNDLWTNAEGQVWLFGWDVVRIDRGGATALAHPSSGTITRVSASPSTSIWALAAGSGMAAYRYDGGKWVYIDSKPEQMSYPNAQVKSLFSNARGSVWLAGSFGTPVPANEVAMMASSSDSGTKWTHSKLMDSTGNEQSGTINAIWEDGRGRVWVCASRRPCQLDRMNPGKCLPSTGTDVGCTDIRSDITSGISTDTVWAISSTAILRFNGTIWERPPGLQSDSKPTLSKLVVSPKSEIWAVGSSGTVFQWTDDSLKLVDYSFVSGSRSLTAIAAAGNDVWVSDGTTVWKLARSGSLYD